MVRRQQIECNQCGIVSAGVLHTIGATVLEICPKCLKQLREWLEEVLKNG